MSSGIFIESERESLYVEVVDRISSSSEGIVSIVIWLPIVDYECYIVI